MIRYSTMLFDFLKKIFGWADEGSKKRKICEIPSFEKEFVTPKRPRNTYNSTVLSEDYFDIYDENDDIEFLSEQKFSPIKSYNKLNGAHKNTPQSYQSHSTALSPRCKSTYSSTRWNKTNMRYFSNQKHKMEDTNYKCPTLSKTNQLKEKHQYEELLQNFLPRRIHIFKDKHEEQTPVREPVEVIELDKPETSVLTSKNTQRVTKLSELSSGRHKSLLLNNSNIDKGKVPILDHSRKDIAIYSQSNKNKTGRSNVNVAKSVSTTSIRGVMTNSLRDELSAKAVMRQDFIPQVAKRYNERIEQRHKEVEELKRMTCVLSKHNRYAREAALEEQLARTMKLCLAVLDEREEPEEPSLVTLTEDILQEVKDALIPRPPDDVLIESFGLRITRKDIHTLSGLNWLNDEVINFYMNLLIARGTMDKYPKVHAMNTFFYPKLISGGHSSLRRWTRKVDIFAQDIVVVPIHLGIHWCMSIIDFRDKSILYYDSMGNGNPKCLAALKQYLQEESLDKKKETYNMNDWKLQSAENIPQQMNGSDCGVFSCMFAEYICANKKITFTQEDMPYFRNKMVYEILRAKLL